MSLSSSVEYPFQPAFLRLKRIVLCMGDMINDLLLTHICDVFSCEDAVQAVAFPSLYTVEGLR